MPQLVDHDADCAACSFFSNVDVTAADAVLSAQGGNSAEAMARVEREEHRDEVVLVKAVFAAVFRLEHGFGPFEGAVLRLSPSSKNLDPRFGDLDHARHHSGVELHPSERCCVHVGHALLGEHLGILHRVRGLGFPSVLEHNVQVPGGGNARR